MLADEIRTASKRIPDTIRQAYSIVVTVNESNDIHAFKIVVTDEPLFTIIKADKRSRIQETAISAEAMMPGGPYDLWREAEQSPPGQRSGRCFRAVPKTTQDAARKGDSGYGHTRGSAGNLGGTDRATRPHNKDILAHDD